MSRTAPLIGITTYVMEATWGPTTSRIALVPATYYELVAASGARPIVLPHVEVAGSGPTAATAEILDALDALVVIGGNDVGPDRYGAALDPATGRIDVVRDSSELALLTGALERDLPVLAICRGHQLLNVALGGTLIQHVPEVVGHAEHQPAWGSFTDREVTCVPGSVVASIFGERPTVPCSHHQAVGELGASLVATAFSVEDEGISPVIEAIERPGARFCVGVQWHPEQAGDRRPFDALVASI